MTGGAPRSSVCGNASRKIGVGEALKIIIAGASGLLGTALTKSERAAGQSVAHMVRPGGPTDDPGWIWWDPENGSVDAAGLEGADAVVNLSGASVGEGRWTAERKRILRSSRIDSTRVLVNAMGGLAKKPAVFVSASATGIYGDRGDEILIEESEPGEDFLARLARDWEAEAARAEAHGIRTVILRFGVVLAAKGGALPRMLAPFRFGLGETVGSGKQWMAWIALADAVGAIQMAIADERLRGAANAVAPNPVTSGEFTRIAARVLHRPALFRVPRLALKMAFGEMGEALLLGSQRAVPKRLLDLGFKFACPEIEPALREIIGEASENG